MKRINRILAALLAALMLCGAWTAVAEMDVELEIEAPGYSEGVDPKTGDNETEVELELDDGLQLDGVDLPALDTEIEMEGDLLIDEAEARGEESVQSNDSDSDFEIYKGVLLRYYGPGGDVVVIPDGVTRIGKSAFEHSNMTSVAIPNSVTNIGDRAFAYCENLTRVTIPNSVTSIGDRAFYECKRLTSVTIPNSVTSIGESAFYKCKCLTSITIPDSVKYIKDSTFWGCNSLTSVTIPSSVTDIADWAFCDCKRLTSVTILAKSIYIHDYAFYDSNPTFYIISGSNEIDWAEREGYKYFVINDALSDKNLKLIPGQTHRLYVVGKNGGKVTWSSSDKNVATVENGKVMGKKIGKCVISATLEDGKTLSCNVKVYDPAELSATTLNLNLDETYRLIVAGLLKRKVTWASSNTAIATVKNGVITPKKAGKCIITAKLGKSQYLEARTLTCKLTVKDSAVISDPTLSLPMGNTHTLTITGLAKRKVTWTSSNKKIATVKNGIVTAIKAGKCTITAQIKDGKKLTCQLTVTDPAALSAEKLTISTIDSATIKLTGALKRQVTWSTSNSNVVKITNSDSSAATIKAVKTGTATITAKIEGGKTLKCVVTVVNPLTIVEDWDDDFYDLASWEVGVKFTNNSNKKIVYITFDILQYNNRGDKLKSPYDYYYFNNDLDPHRSYWDNYTVNDDTRSVKFKVREVTFADKTTWRP